MKAGPEMDALIAEKVTKAKPRLSYVCSRDNGASIFITFPMPAQAQEWIDKNKQIKGLKVVEVKDYPMYSKLIEPAWEVVEKLSVRYRVFRIHRSLDGKHSALIGNGDYGADTDMNWDIWVTGDTAPLAICLAALKAVGVKV